MANVAPSTPHVGTVLDDRYELVRHLARGGMGDVYEATDAVLQRAVAVKVFRSAGPADRARFDAEVHVLAGLGHPGLVRVFDAGSHGDDAYVVLELIDGPPLSETLAARGRLPYDETARLGAEVAESLAYIHARGVVHRDVTPSNVLCDQDGRPRLVDFGIARLLDGPRVTTTSLTVGTPSYMAPEQLQGSAVTPAADVYALGLVLLEALTGRRAFEGTVQETAMARLASGPDVPADLPGPWRGLLISMTSRTPTARPTAAEARDRLLSLAGTGEVAEISTAEVPVMGVDAPTQVLAAADGGTQVLSVPPLLVADAEVSHGPGEGRPWSPIWLAAAGVLALLLVVALAAAAGRGEDETPATTTVVPQTTVAADPGQGRGRTQVTEAPTTTQAPTTTAAVVPDTLLPQDGFPFEEGTQPGKEKKAADATDPAPLAADPVDPAAAPVAG